MRLPKTLPLTLLLLSCLEGATGRKSKENSEKAKPSSPWAQSGQFSTWDKHLCSWQLIPGENTTELQLSCHPPRKNSSKMGQQCVYRGQPELCAAYNSKGRQFWKQVLGKLRKKRHPCQDSTPLKSRLCSSKKGASEAELHLVPSTHSPMAAEIPVATEGTVKDAPGKQSKVGKRRDGPGSSLTPSQPPSRQPTAVAEGTEQPTELNADVVEAYCEEKWHSLCNFFVNFWNG
uniref:Fibroblast growth factor binding protein 3 n=1 Tax=Varanus komodoensis TaxID=61221 RepID=A0A8D2IPR4_VARKO